MVVTKKEQLKAPGSGSERLKKTASSTPFASLRETWFECLLAFRTAEAANCKSDSAELNAPSSQRFPVDLPTVHGGLGFLLQHESYHIGQLALLRKYFGYPAMRYV